jgi:putative colanic acid biosynthesis UDP-glucose lipid carrier transferase
MEERIKRDIWYMEHWSFWLDIQIIIKTVKNAIQGDEQAF